MLFLSHTCVTESAELESALERRADSNACVGSAMAPSAPTHSQIVLGGVGLDLRASDPICRRIKGFPNVL